MTRRGAKNYDNKERLRRGGLALQEVLLKQRYLKAQELFWRYYIQLMKFRVRVDGIPRHKWLDPWKEEERKLRATCYVGVDGLDARKMELTEFQVELKDSAHGFPQWKFSVVYHYNNAGRR